MLYLSKLVPIFVYPLGLTFSLLAIAGIAALLGYRRLKLLTFTFAILVLWVSSTPTVASWALYSLEKQYPAKPMAETLDADVAIILGGAIGQLLPPKVEQGLDDRQPIIPRYVFFRG